jgi:homoserine O-acetyltransferase
MDFPFFTVRDSVNVEYRFLKEYLGLEHVLAVTGPSIGAQKSYQFAVSYPNYITAAICQLTHDQPATACTPAVRSLLPGG